MNKSSRAPSISDGAQRQLMVPVPVAVTMAVAMPETVKMMTTVMVVANKERQIQPVMTMAAEAPMHLLH